MLRRLNPIALTLALLTLMSLARAQEGGGTPSFRNPDLPAEARAADLAGRLTLAEKVSQMQNASPAIERLGIPAYEWWNEALHGVARAGRATVFPQAIGLAATWDTSLMFQVADTISTEARAKYNLAQRSGGRGRYHGLTFWSPNVNIFRDPRWGRGQETYGEDPFLTSRMAVAFIQGMQGGAQGGVKNNDSRYWKTVATPKHFAVHSGPEPLRHSFDVHPSATDLNDTYLPAFEASVVEGEAASVMCSYNRIDGVPACANSFLLQERLRDTWGFQGYVVSDCGAITDIVEGHQYKANLAGAAASAVKAGTDLTCGDEYAALPEAVKSGLISEGVIDAALRRLFVARIRLGMFDPAERVPYASIGEAENDSPAHRQAALQAARESIVLLKNAALSNRTHILPLKSVRKIAVIGPAADDPDALLANYHGTPSSTVTPLAGMRRQFGGATEIRYALGSTFSTVSPTLVPADSLIVPPHAGTARQPGDDAHGLLAQYFANPDFRGEPAMSRREDQVYLQRERGDSELESRLPPNGYSVRWSGSLTAPYSGEYDLGIVRLRCEDCAGDDEARLFLDDRLVLEDARPSSASRVVKTTKLSFRRGRKYRVRVEYRQRSGGVGLQLIWIPPAQPLLDEARDAIKRSEVTVAFVGLNAELEGEEMPVRIPGFSGGDRTTLDLPQPQEQLLEAARRTGKPLVVVLLTGSAVAMNFAQENSSAVLEAWYGGEEAGTAIAETLAGKNNPAGRLPITFYQSVNDLPAFDDYAMRGRTYRYFAGRTLYPFGAGLSYSAFRYSGLRIAPTSGSEERIHVSADVQNTSALAGDEVVQLYVAGEGGTEDDPIRELRGFQRVHLAPGESRLIEFDLDRAALRRHARGKLRISVGGGQPLGDTPHVEALF